MIRMMCVCVCDFYVAKGDSLQCGKEICSIQYCASRKIYQLQIRNQRNFCDEDH